MRNCYSCDGTGKRECEDCDCGKVFDKTKNKHRDCFSCDGTGKIECQDCEGTGNIED